MSQKSLKILAYDGRKSGIDKAEFWYSAGAFLFSAAFDIVADCRSPEDVYKLLGRHPGAGELQTWNHGSPGRISFGGKALDPDNAAFKSLAGGVLWARCCKSAQGTFGHHLAERLGKQGVSYVGHLANIGTGGHSYLVGCRAGAKPWWNPSFAAEGSLPWAPRTVTPMKMSLPKWAFDKDERLVAK